MMVAALVDVMAVGYAQTSSAHGWNPSGYPDLVADHAVELGADGARCDRAPVHLGRTAAVGNGRGWIGAAKS